MIWRITSPSTVGGRWDENVRAATLEWSRTLKCTSEAIAARVCLVFPRGTTTTAQDVRNVVNKHKRQARAKAGETIQAGA